MFILKNNHASLKIFLIILSTLILGVAPYNYLNSNVSSDFYLNTTDELIINQNKKFIQTNNNFLLLNNLYKFSGKNITIWYKSLNKLNLDNLYRIEANTNIKIENKNYNSIISADKYIYSNKAGIHTLIASKNNIIYKDPLRTLTAKDRFEYFINKNLIVIRGYPKIIGKYNTNSNTYYNFSADLINIQLTNINQLNQKINRNSLTNKNIVFIEAINNVNFNEGNTTIIADYAIYYNEQNQIEFYDNVKFNINGSSVQGNSAIYNLSLGYGKIISSNKDTSIKGKYQPHFDND